jgi:hypothetical protein
MGKRTDWREYNRDTDVRSVGQMLRLLERWGGIVSKPEK